MSHEDKAAYETDGDAAYDQRQEANAIENTDKQHEHFWTFLQLAGVEQCHECDSVKIEHTLSYSERVQVTVKFTEREPIFDVRFFEREPEKWSEVPL